MASTPLDIFWVFITGTAVLFILMWAIIVTTILYRRRHLAVEQEKLEAIQRSKELYRRFFEEDLTGDFIATGEGQILSCNPAFAKIFGFPSVADALRINFASLYPNANEFKAFLERLKQEKKLEYHEAELIASGGDKVYVIQNIIPELDDEGNLKQFRGYIFDNTERKQLEQQLLQAQKMQSIGTLAGGVAHDFNNILSIILGHASLLQERDYAGVVKADSIEAILNAVKRGANLVEQILTFARKADIVFESADLNHLVKELVHMLSETFPKTVLFETHLDPYLPPIRADQNQLHQALLNLCVNARDAMPNGGTITITTRVAPREKVVEKFPEAKPVDFVVVSVKDSGTGMDEDTRKRLFEPFFTTKQRGRGTGLGLAVVYGIVSSHYGFIDLESELGKGTTFHFYFPAVEEQVQREETTRTDRPIAGTETILLVEDEEMLIDLLSTILQVNGYHLFIARDGLEAVELFRQFRDQINLVFSDSGLPKLGGWEAFLRMREISPSIQAVFASGYFDPDLKTEMQKQGVMDFIQKPYSPQDVVKRLRAALDQLEKLTP